MGFLIKYFYIFSFCFEEIEQHPEKRAEKYRCARFRPAGLLGTYRGEFLLNAVSFYFLK